MKLRKKQDNGTVWLILILGIASLVPVGYVLYGGIRHLITTKCGFTDTAWTIGGMLGFLAIPLALIVPALTVLIKERRKRNPLYECKSEMEPVSKNPKRDLTIFKVGVGISLVLITIGTVIILSNREKKAMGVEVEGTVIDKRSENKHSYFTVEFSINGKTETHELQANGPVFGRKMKLYVSKETYATIFDDEDDRHFILYYQNQYLLWILFFFGSAVFIIFVVSVLTFSDDVETTKNQ